MQISRFTLVCLAAGLLVWQGLFSGCSVQTQTRKLTLPQDARRLDKSSQYLKVHLRNGSVCVLSRWQVSPDQHFVSGDGTLLGINRQVLGEGRYNIGLDTVDIFETNVVRTSDAVAALALVTGASVAVTIYCAANPKACFGSCPTFYTDDGSGPRLQAEGFSASIAPSLEATDIDALYRAHPMSRRFDVEMRNEALETHVIRYVDLLVAHRRSGERILAAANGAFWEAGRLVEPSRCVGPEGDCTELVRRFDGSERTSLADSVRLNAKETIELTFDDVSDSALGLVLACRQSLLSTYLFYQALAYMGNSAGEWLARLARGDARARKLAGGIGRELGGIEILIRNTRGRWVRAGQINETGPLASDVHLIPLPKAAAGSKQIRLVLTKGHWRLDYVALAVLGNKITPIRIKPSTVWHDSTVAEAALATLRNRTGALTTFPGDVYSMTYELPADYQDYELFLETRGYYLEWMRDEWLAEENPAMAAMMFLHPDEAMRRLAPQFKAVESSMEQTFWSSRYARQ